MAKKKSKRRGGEPKPLKREDIHARPKQGTTPWEGPPHHGNPSEDHPKRYVPILLDSHVAGIGGMTTGNPNLKAPAYGFGRRSHEKTDQRILDDVCARLTLHGELHVGELDVHCRNAVIRLEGRVPSSWMSREIAAVSESVYGVAKVDNELVVEANN